MDYNYKQTPLSQAVFSGLFAGIIAALINLVYNYIVRDVTGFSPSSFINVSSIIFASVLLPVVAGVVFYFLNLWMKKRSAALLFTVVFTLLTTLVVVKGLFIQRSAIPTEIIDFRWLFTGVMLTIGGLITFCIPYLYRKDYF